MNYLSYPLSYFVNGKPCTSFSFTKKNKSTASYEIRLTDSFSVRVYLPLALCSKLSKSETIPKEIYLLVCLPENLELCKVASFESFPSDN